MEMNGQLQLPVSLSPDLLQSRSGHSENKENALLLPGIESGCPARGLIGASMQISLRHKDRLHGLHSEHCASLPECLRHFHISVFTAGAISFSAF